MTGVSWGKLYTESRRRIEAMKEKAAEQYRKGKITLSKAARMAETTLWGMEQFLVEKGFTSKYSVGDLQEELNSLAKINHKA